MAERLCISGVQHAVCDSKCIEARCTLSILKVPHLVRVHAHQKFHQFFCCPPYKKGTTAKNNTMWHHQNIISFPPSPMFATPLIYYNLLPVGEKVRLPILIVLFCLPLYKSFFWSDVCCSRSCFSEAAACWLSCLWFLWWADTQPWP